MHIEHVVTSLKWNGFWYTYHMMTSMPFNDSRMDALWKIWVARQHMLHKDGRSMRERFVDWALN